MTIFQVSRIGPNRFSNDSTQTKEYVCFRPVLGCFNTKSKLYFFTSYTQCNIKIRLRLRLYSLEIKKDSHSFYWLKLHTVLLLNHCISCEALLKFVKSFYHKNALQSKANRRLVLILLTAVILPLTL